MISFNHKNGKNKGLPGKMPYHHCRDKARAQAGSWQRRAVGHPERKTGQAGAGEGTKSAKQRSRRQKIPQLLAAAALTGSSAWEERQMC